MGNIIQLQGKQRAALRKVAAGLDTIFQIGKGGIGENMLRQISDALDARELIKLRVLDAAEYTADSAAEKIAEILHAAVVQCIGTRFVLYRPNPDKAARSAVVGGDLTRSTGVSTVKSAVSSTARKRR